MWVLDGIISAAHATLLAGRGCHGDVCRVVRVLGGSISLVRATTRTGVGHNVDVGGGVRVSGGPISPVRAMLLAGDKCEGAMGDGVRVSGGSVARTTPLTGDGRDGNIYGVVRIGCGVIKLAHVSALTGGALQPFESDHRYTGLLRYPSRRLEWPPYPNRQLGWPWNPKPWSGGLPYPDMGSNEL